MYNAYVEKMFNENAKPYRGVALMLKQQEELRMDKTKCIPKNWGVVKLGEICEITMGQSPPSESYNMEGKGMPFLQGKQEFGSNHPVNVKYTTKPLKIAFENSILISVRAPVGDVNIADKTYCIGRGLASLRAKKGIIALFLYYLMAFQKSDVEAIGEGSTFQAITKSQIFNFKVLVPPVSEQRKIAEILETIDNAIEKTDAIIEKYKRIKQGLMQDLLTKGIDENWQIRNEKTHKFKDSLLGRIPEEWKVVKLKDVADIRLSNVDKKTDLKGKIIQLCNYLEVYQNDYIIKGMNFMHASATNNEIKKFKISKGDVIITKDSEEYNDIAKPAYVRDEIENLICGYHLALIKPLNNINGLFLSKVLSFRNVNIYFQQRANGITRFGLTKETITGAIIPLPLIPEQERIATILFQIDEVIEKEQAYKEKLERIKKGLMEDLLTGKVRVNHLLIEEEGKDDN